MKSTYSEIILSDFPLYKKGKVRDVYEVGDNLLIIASDRISAFDYVLPSLIPNKGKILTQLSKFWFEFTSLVCSNHMITADFDDYPPELAKLRDLIEKRSMLAKKTEVLPVECVVRGYLEGSGWRDYKATGETSGVRLPSGLKQCDRLDKVIFTPATKAEEGHDINISFREMQKMVGAELSQKVQKASVELYQKASLHALSRGIIIADTKFEFGLLGGEIILVDEIFTPDSSRFWPVASYTPGQSQPSLDKQFVREYLDSTEWDKQSPPPPLPPDIIEQTSKRYMEIYRLLTEKNEL